jgi:hypothetical protein
LLTAATGLCTDQTLWNPVDGGSVRSRNGL